MIHFEEALWVVVQVVLEAVCILRSMTLCLVGKVRVRVEMVELRQVRDMILLDQVMDRREVVEEDLVIHLVDLETMISSNGKRDHGMY